MHSIGANPTWAAINAWNGRLSVAARLVPDGRILLPLRFQLIELPSFVKADQELVLLPIVGSEELPPLLESRPEV